MRIEHTALEYPTKDRTPDDTGITLPDEALFANFDVPSTPEDSLTCFVAREHYQYWCENLRIGGGLSLSGTITGSYSESVTVNETITMDWDPSDVAAADRIGGWAPPGSYVPQTRNDRFGIGDDYPHAMQVFTYPHGKASLPEFGWTDDIPSGGWEWQSDGVEYDPVSDPGMDYFIRIELGQDPGNFGWAGTGGFHAQGDHIYLEDWGDSNSELHRWQIGLGIGIVGFTDDGASGTRGANWAVNQWEWRGKGGGETEYDHVVTTGPDVELVFPDGTAYDVPLIYFPEDPGPFLGASPPNEITQMSGTITITVL